MNRYHNNNNFHNNNNNNHHSNNQTSAADDCSVHFSGAPQSVTENQIRTLFEQLGHVSGLRLIPNRTRPLMDGYVDFSDAADAKAAVERLNGHLFSPSSAASAAEAASVIGGEFKLQVQLASTRKRQRENNNGGGGGGRGGGGGGRGGGGGHHHNNNNNSSSNGQATVQPFDSDDEDGGPAGPALCLPKHYKDPISQALTKYVSMSDAFEAIEQLRVISLEKPDETKELLEQHPALKVAVVEILQLAGRLPTPLPSEAFRTYTSTNIRTIIRQEERGMKQQLVATGGASAAAASAPAVGGVTLTTTVPLASSFAAGAAAAASAAAAAAAAAASASNSGFSDATAAKAAAASSVQFTTDQLLEKVEKLSEPQLAKIKGSKLEDFDKLPEPHRSLFKQLNVFLNSM